ncbi:MAG: hypothetical protein U0903_01930 [Planctomycetales bacterium]
MTISFTLFCSAVEPRETFESDLFTQILDDPPLRMGQQANGVPIPIPLKMRSWEKDIDVRNPDLPVIFSAFQSTKMVDHRSLLARSRRETTVYGEEFDIPIQDGEMNLKQTARRISNHRGS